MKPIKIMTLLFGAAASISASNMAFSDTALANEPALITDSSTVKTPRNMSDRVTPVNKITIESCGKLLTFDKIPERAVFNDLNMVQMAFALELQPHMVAVSGVSGWYKTPPEFKKQLGNIPEISPKYLSLEPLLNTQADFLFAGWNYGLRLGSELTPENFARFGIKTLELSESCVHIQQANKKASMNLLYDDMIKLGTVFNKKDLAEKKVTAWKDQLATIKVKLGNTPKKKVFLYDSGVDRPLTSGKYAMPQALIDAAGGENIMEQANFSWSQSTWEQVAMADPDMIILVDYNNEGAMGPAQLKTILKNHPLMQHTKAVKNDQYLLLNYSEITPGPDNIAAIAKIAQRLYSLGQ